MKTKEIQVEINGQMYVRTVNVATTLAEFLRDDLQLTGTKIGCNEGECGACTVIFNGAPVNSCLVLAAETDGGKVPCKKIHTQHHDTGTGHDPYRQFLFRHLSE